MESVNYQQQTPVEITPYGLHSSRYNSLLSVPEFNIALYVLGNQILVHSFETNEVVYKEKICEQSLQVISQCITC